MNDDPFRQHAAAIAADFRLAAGFLTRIPMAAFGGAAEQRFDFRRTVRVFPLIGALIGTAGGLILILSAALGIPSLVGAVLAVAAIVGLTGGLHEDGLADTADGFGGGTTATRKLEIMDDSRIGSFGVIALLVSLLLRVAIVAALVPTGGLRALAALAAAEAASRGAMVWLWYDLPAARPGGAADKAGPPDEQPTFLAVIGALVIAVLAILPTFGIWAMLAGLAALIATAIGCARLSVHQIGGQTGDTLGACQQCTSIAFLIGITPFI